MTARQKLEEKGWNINSIIGLLTIAGMILTGVFFIAPLRTLPDDQKDLSKQVRDISQTVAIQTAALQTLADVATDTRTDTKAMRRDVDNNSSRLNEAHRRLDKLESQP